MTPATPFETDIAEQPPALRRLAAAAAVPDLAAIAAQKWDRIILTGMGSSYYASIPTWRHLASLGHAAWVLDTGYVLDNPALITSGTLLVVTSQSGASGEIVELLNQRADGRINPAMLVGIADNEISPLAESADLFVALHSGPEATVSTKSYLNTLGVHRFLMSAFGGQSPDQVQSELVNAAETVERILATVDVTDAAAAAAQHPQRRLAYVGRGDESATALFAGLITKEAAKIPAEGFVGGQFRHGPFELAGDGLTAVMFGLGGRNPDASLARLTRDLVATGSHVILVGDHEFEGALTISAGGRDAFSSLCASSVVAELFAVGLARANGVVPGEFRYGSKITTAV